MEVRNSGRVDDLPVKSTAETSVRSVDGAASTPVELDSGGFGDVVDTGRFPGRRSANMPPGSVDPPPAGNGFFDTAIPGRAKGFTGARKSIDGANMPGMVDNTASTYYLDTADLANPLQADMTNSKLFQYSVDGMEFGDLVSVDGALRKAKTPFTSQLRMGDYFGLPGKLPLGKAAKKVPGVSVDAPIEKIGVEKVTGGALPVGPTQLVTGGAESTLGTFRDSFQMIQSGDLAGGAKTILSDLSGKVVQGLKFARDAVKKELFKTTAAILAPVVILAIAMFGIIGAVGSIVSVGSVFSLTAYPSEDAEITGSTFGATNYCEDLKEEVREIPSQPEWSHIDEFKYIPSLDAILSEINYDPWLLQAYLNATFPGYAAADVAAEVNSVLAELLQIKLNEIVEIRYRHDSNGDLVSYPYYILEISLIKGDLETIVRDRMNGDEIAMFDVYMNDDLLGTHEGVRNPFTFDWRPYITDRFGWRDNPTHPESGRELHTGLDLGVAQGTPIYAGISGYVTNLTLVGSGPYGNRVEITSLDGKVMVLYAHMDSISVIMDQPVISGVTEIGKVGTTGNSNGFHLHIEVRTNGQLLDPLFILGYGVSS